jgi:hypothetical protein
MPLHFSGRGIFVALAYLICYTLAMVVFDPSQPSSVLQQQKDPPGEGEDLFVCISKALLERGDKYLLSQGLYQWLSLPCLWRLLEDGKCIMVRFFAAYRYPL